MAEIIALPDSHISVRAFFPVPEGKLEEIKSYFAKCYEITRAGTGATGKCLYYGFAIYENTVLVREGYKCWDDLLAHISEINSELTQFISMVGSDFHADIFGLEAELEKLKEPLKDFPNVRYYVLDQGSRTFFKLVDQVAEEDNHITIAPYFTVIFFHPFICPLEKKQQKTEFFPFVLIIFSLQIF